MSRIYDALKKHENGKGGAVNGNGNLSADGRKPETILLGEDVPERVAYQRIRVWLTNPSKRGAQPRTVMVVACRTGTGCTTTAALLGATLAEGKGSRVLIIDGNFRTPSMNMVFQLKNNGGFSDIITQGLPFEASIQPTNRKNLFVLTTGQISMVPAELFEGETIDKLLSTLSKQFDFIIFDSAPLLEYPDSYALAPKVDCVILVVGAEKTSIEDARRAKRDLERAGGQTLGVVLNRKRDYRPPFIKKFFAGLG